MFRGVLMFLFLISPSIAVAEVTDSSREAAIDVIRYSLALRPDIETGSVSGTETVQFVARADLREIEFSPNSLAIDSATIDGKPSEVSSTEKGVVFTPVAFIPAGR